MIIFMIDKEWDINKNSRCIEVKGMNGLSVAYIQRFFGHAGHVEQVKKNQDIVVVRFKSQASIAKALRFNGRLIDKQPIKIRSAMTYHEQIIPHKKKQIFNSRQAQKIDQLIENRIFDISVIWKYILKVISKYEDTVDQRILWLLHEMFFLKFSQVVHFHAFGTNLRSNYSQIVIKQNFVNESGKNKNSITFIQNQGPIQRMQMLVLPQNQLQDQPNFQCLIANSQIRLKSKFQQYFHSTQGNRLFQLYELLNAYSLYIPQQQSIFSTQLHGENSINFSTLSSQVTQNRAHINLMVPNSSSQRSEYRQITVEHPNKQIQILSDSYLNQNPVQSTTYDIFKDNFDGNLTNNCAIDLFWHFRMHFASNFIVIRYKNQSKAYRYFRLDFQLRIIGCHNQSFSQTQFYKIFKYSQDKEKPQQVIQLKLSKHNLLIADFQKNQKVIYLLQNYVRFMTPQLHSLSADSQHCKQLIAVFFIISNPSSQNKAKLQQLCMQIFKKIKIRQSFPKVYAIQLVDHQKFDKIKCTNFIQQYVDALKGASCSMQLAKLHARKIIQQNPSRFKHLINPQQFVTQTLWRLQQQKSKRQAKNRLKIQLHRIRTT